MPAQSTAGSMRVTIASLVLLLAATSGMGSAWAVPGAECSFSYDVACTHAHASEDGEQRHFCREYLDVGGSHDFFSDPCHHGPGRPY